MATMLRRVRTAADDLPVLRRAGSKDREAVIAMARAFHDEDGHPLDAAGEAAIVRLLADPGLGVVYLVEASGEPIGYAVLCFSYSIEWGGRDAFIDDLYLAGPWRGRGIGSAIIEALSAAARADGCSALHLEVIDGNPAQALYRRQGFTARGSLFMSRRLGVTI